MSAKIIIYLLTFNCLFLSLVNSQICTKKVVTYTRVMKTYSEFRRETYRGQCGYGSHRCILSRWVTVTSMRAVPKREVTTVKFCCTGYMRTDDYSDNSNITCDAICVPSCKNGYCKSPGECACSEGYLPSDGTDYHNCFPTCANGCNHGTCIAPDVCECNAGYIFNQTCQPSCSDPCHNGFCEAPDICKCLPGYRKSENNICEPYCSSGCENGTCVEPEICQCNPGYQRKYNESDITPPTQACSTVCSDSCYNGTCVAPEVCECWPGYERSENKTCQPICVKGCENGTCVAPNTCQCEPGWSLSSSTNESLNSCQPICSEPCGNGTCVAPDTCDCSVGYVWNATCLPECPSGCDGGECTAPGVCNCSADWEYEDGKCVPKCDFECGNGTCVAPNDCECFKGYHIDVDRVLKDIEDETVCIPSCSNCSSSCIAPDMCVGETTTTSNWNQDVTDDYDLDSNDTISNETGFPANNQEMTIVEKANEIRRPWIQENWLRILVPALVIIMILVVLVFVVSRRKALHNYFKGGSYTVEDSRLMDSDTMRSKNSEMSFSNLRNREKSS